MRLSFLFVVVFMLACSNDSPCPALQTVEVPNFGLLSIPGISSYSPYSSTDKVKTIENFGVYTPSEEALDKVSLSYSGGSLQVKANDTSNGWISIRKDFGGFVDLSSYSGIRFKISLANKIKNYYQVRISFGDICSDDPEEFTLFPKSEHCNCSSVNYNSWDYGFNGQKWLVKTEYLL